MRNTYYICTATGESRWAMPTAAGVAGDEKGGDDDTVNRHAISHESCKFLRPPPPISADSLRVDGLSAETVFQNEFERAALVADTVPQPATQPQSQPPYNRVRNRLWLGMMLARFPEFQRDRRSDLSLHDWLFTLLPAMKPAKLAELSKNMAEAATLPGGGKILTVADFLNDPVFPKAMATGDLAEVQKATDWQLAVRASKAGRGGQPAAGTQCSRTMAQPPGASNGVVFGSVGSTAVPAQLEAQNIGFGVCNTFYPCRSGQRRHCEVPDCGSAAVRRRRPREPPQHHAHTDNGGPGTRCCPSGRPWPRQAGAGPKSKAPGPQFRCRGSSSRTPSLESGSQATHPSQPAGLTVSL